MINEDAEPAADFSDEEELPDFLDKKEAAKNAGDQVVIGVDGETLAQNVTAPYLFVTFRPYADRNQILKGDLSQLSQDPQGPTPFLQV